MLLLSVILQAFALLTGVFFFSKIKPPVYRALIIVLFFSTTNELFILNNGPKLYGVNKHILYNTFFIIHSVVSFVIFYNCLYPVRRKQYLVFYIISSLIAITFLVLKKMIVFNPLYLSVISLQIMTGAGMYLYQVYKKEGYHQLKTDSLFWYSVGSIIVFFFFFSYLSATHNPAFMKNETGNIIYRVLNTIGNLIYYSLIIMSFLCSNISQKQSGT